MGELKILFALTKNKDNKLEKTILKVYKEKFNQEFTYKKEYYKEGVFSELNKNKYSILFLDESLDLFEDKGQEVSLKDIENIIDLQNDLKIILRLKDNKIGSQYVQGLLNLGCFNAIFHKDFKVNNIVELMGNSRTRKSAKEYYELEDISMANMSQVVSTNLKTIDDEEMGKVLDSLNSATEENIEELFEVAKETYNFEQLTYLISMLNLDPDKKVINLFNSKNCDISEYLTANKGIVEIVEKIVEVEKIIEKVVEVEKVVEIEKIVEVEKNIENTVVINKEVVKVETYRSDSIITFISASSTGKSFLSWNLAYALSKKYSVAYVNIDSSCSSNCYFGIDEKEQAFENIENKNLKDIIEGGCEINSNLTVYTSTFGTNPYLKNDIFHKVIQALRNENNVVIIDTASGLSDNLITALNFSNDVLMIYDLDNSHIKMNDLFLEKLESNISPKNTLAIINNAYSENKEIKNVTKYLKEKSMFKDVTTLSNCGPTTYDYMYSNTCNYLKDDNNFTSDLDYLISLLKLEGKSKSKNKENGSIRKIFKKFRKER